MGLRMAAEFEDEPSSSPSAETPWPPTAPSRRRRSKTSGTQLQPWLLLLAVICWFGIGLLLAQAVLAMVLWVVEFVTRLLSFGLGETDLPMYALLG